MAVRVELGGPMRGPEIVVDAGGIIDDLGEVLDSISTEILISRPSPWPCRRRQRRIVLA